MAVLDASERGEIRLLSDEECDENETGITIQIGVRADDIDEFHEKARDAFKFYNPRPDINIDLPEAVTESIVTRGDGGWLAIMGGVPYPIALSQLDVPKPIRQSGGVVFFGIGELRVAASREALKYDEFTKANLVKSLNDTLDRYVTSFTRSVAELTTWAKRVKLQGMGLFGGLLASIIFPGVFEDNLDMGKVKTKDIRFKFTKIGINEKTRLVFIDDTRSIKGYGLGERDLVVRRAVDSTYVEAWKGLQAMIREMRIEGISVVRSSDLEWTRPPSGARSYSKTRVKNFQFNPAFQQPRRGRRAALSNHWEPVERTQTDDDVYVVIEPGYHTPLYDEYRNDAKLLGVFGIQMPTVYGYKRSPDGGNVHPGITYHKWKERIYDMVVAKMPVVETLISMLPYQPYTYSDYSTKGIGKMIEALGEKHAVTEVVSTVRAAKVLFVAHSGKIDAVKTLVQRMNRSEREPKDLQAIYRQYPLLHEHIGPLLSENPKHYIEYVQAIDCLNATRQKEVANADAA